MEIVLAALATKALYGPVIRLVAKPSFTKQPWVDGVEQVPWQKQFCLRFRIRCRWRKPFALAVGGVSACFCNMIIVNYYWSDLAFLRRHLNLSQITGWCFLALWATWWETQSSAERTRPVSISSISLYQSPVGSGPVSWLWGAGTPSSFFFLETFPPQTSLTCIHWSCSIWAEADRNLHATCLSAWPPRF